MDKKCIFEKDKICNDCGECDRCDLNPDKICNNCGTCLKLEGYDIRSIQIDEIMDDDDKNIDLEEDGYVMEKQAKSEVDEDDPEWEFIDDIKDISELIKEQKNNKELIEEFPGFFRLNKEKE